jgi:hypothetical protein
VLLLLKSLLFVFSIAQAQKAAQWLIMAYLG